MVPVKTCQAPTPFNAHVQLVTPGPDAKLISAQIILALTVFVKALQQAIIVLARQATLGQIVISKLTFAAQILAKYP